MKFWTWANRILYFTLILSVAAFFYLKEVNHPWWAAASLLLAIFVLFVLPCTVATHNRRRRAKREERRYELAQQRAMRIEFERNTLDNHTYGWYMGSPVESFPAGLTED